MPDPEHPDAEVVADTHLTLDELIDAVDVHDDDGVLLHFDVKYDPERTLDADAFAEEIIGCWNASGLPNPWYMSAGHPDFIRAASGRVPRLVHAPPHRPRRRQHGERHRGRAAGQLGVADQIGLARQSGAAGLNVAYQVVDRAVVDAARREGLTVQVWTVNDPALLGFYCRWPVEALITDYPERAPCL